MPGTSPGTTVGGRARDFGLTRASAGVGPGGGVKRPAGAAMMASMTTAKPEDRAIAADQLDLFDERPRGAARRPPAPVAPVAPPADRLTDGELIAAVAQAGPSTVGPLCAEIVSRSLETAVPALESLWRRFAGFGVCTPLAEQLAVLATLARLGGEAARAGLRRIVLSQGLPASLLPAALRAAADAGLALPAAFVAPLLDHGDTDVREPAFELAPGAGVRADLLREGLRDRSASIRRSAAIAMGNRGLAEAGPVLIAELARDPSTAVIEALAAIADDDAVVHLGRCAERHPSLAGAVVVSLRHMESERAARLARRLEAGGPGSEGDAS